MIDKEMLLCIFYTEQHLYIKRKGEFISCERFEYIVQAKSWTHSDDASSNKMDIPICKKLLEAHDILCLNRDVWNGHWFGFQYGIKRVN